MNCPGCGASLPQGTAKCPRCGMGITGVPEDNSAVKTVPASVASSPTSRSNIGKAVIILVILAGLIAAALFISNNGKKEALRKQLAGEWDDIEDSIIKVLEFKDKTVEYRLETGFRYLDRSLGDYEWEPVSGDTIRVKQFGSYRTFKVEFFVDGAVMTISPALTSTASSEDWYRLK